MFNVLNRSVYTFHSQDVHKYKDKIKISFMAVSHRLNPFTLVKHVFFLLTFFFYVEKYSLHLLNGSKPV